MSADQTSLFNGPEIQRPRQLSQGRPRTVDDRRVRSETRRRPRTEPAGRQRQQAARGRVIDLDQYRRQRQVEMRSASRTGSRGSQRSLTVLMSALLVLILASLVWLLPAFHVQRIGVRETTYVDEADIITASGLETGSHLAEGWGGSLGAWFGFRYGASEAAIKAASPYVGDVQVHMAFPGEIRIDVTERVPVSSIAITDGYVLLDQELIVLEFRPQVRPAGIPLITGVQVSSAELGQQLQTPVEGVIDNAMRILDAAHRTDLAAGDSFSLLTSISSVHTTESSQGFITVQLPDSDEILTCQLGQSSGLDAAMSWLRYAVRTGKLNGLGSGVLNLSGDQPVFIRNQTGQE